MAYADYEFYSTRYFGDELTEATAPKWLERASDAVDTITFYRLAQGMPEDDAHVVRVKKGQGGMGIPREGHGRSYLRRRRHQRCADSVHHLQRRRARQGQLGHHDQGVHRAARQR